MEKLVKIGISACLLGERVRYNGEQKFDPCLIESLGGFFTFVPVCPEVGCGLTTPREPMRLEGDPAHPRLVTVETRIDLTERMLSYCGEKLAELEREDLCGFIFKKNSPSSGLHGVKVYVDGLPTGEGSGLFAAQLVRRFPFLPVEEEEGLADAASREKFMERVFSYAGGLTSRPLPATPSTIPTAPLADSCLKGGEKELAAIKENGCHVPDPDSAAALR